MSTNSSSSINRVKLPSIHHPIHSPKMLSDFKFSPQKQDTSRPGSIMSNRSNHSSFMNPNKENRPGDKNILGSQKWKYVERKARRESRRINLHSAGSNQGSIRSLHNQSGQSWKLNSKDNVTKASGFNINFYENNPTLHENLATINSASKHKASDIAHTLMSTEKFVVGEFNFDSPEKTPYKDKNDLVLNQRDLSKGSRKSFSIIDSKNRNTFSIKRNIENLDLSNGSVKKGGLRIRSANRRVDSLSKGSTYENDCDTPTMANGKKSGRLSIKCNRNDSLRRSKSMHDEENDINFETIKSEKKFK